MAKALKYTCPKCGMASADKGYCTKCVAKIMAVNVCYNSAIKKNNVKFKNHQKDNSISGIRIPTYCGLAKVQF